MKHLLIYLSVIFILFSCGSDEIDPTPTVTTAEVTDIALESATAGGNVVGPNSYVIAKGVCWNTTPNPTLNNNFRKDGAGEGNFTSSLTGLYGGTTYYVKAYAINQINNLTDTLYGNEVNFTTAEKPEVVHEGDLYLKRQEDVENFKANGITEVTGRLTINHEINDELFYLKTVGENLYIFYTKKIGGFNNLSSVGGNLVIKSNSFLKEITGFNNLSYVGGEISFEENRNLEKIDGFNNLNTVGGDLIFLENENLKDIEGFNKLSSIGGYLSFSDNDVLSNINGFHNLVTVEGSVRIIYNYRLRSINGLNNLTTINGVLYISGNYSFSNLSCFNNLIYIGGNMNINWNKPLSSLEGLNNVTTIGGDLEIYNSNALKSLDALNNLTSLGKDIKIRYNEKLSDFCGLRPLLLNGFSGQFLVYDNVDSPTQQEIIDGNCN